MTSIRSVLMAGCALLMSGAAEASSCPAFQGLPVTALEADATKRADQLAAAIAPIVSGRRVVMLGEPSHGDGQSMVSRAELVEVLHGRFGFDVIAFEGDFFGLGKPWRSSRDPIRSVARANLYPFWSDTPAVETLWAYIDAQSGSGRLKVAGVDIRLGGQRARTALIPLVTRLSRRNNVTFDGPARRAIGDLLDGDHEISVSAADKVALTNTLTGLSAVLAPESADAALVRSLKAWTAYAWDGASRDVGMADNLRWLADYGYPGRRIIVWAHSNHIIRDEEFWRSTNQGAEPFRHMGNLYAEGRAESVATIGTIASGGSISSDFFRALNWSTAGWQHYDPGLLRPVAPGQVGSLEAHLQATCRSPAVVSLYRGTVTAVGTTTNSTFVSSAVDHSAPMSGDFGKAYDLLLYVGEARGLELR